MTFPVEELVYAILRFDQADRIFLRAVSEYIEYEFQYKTPVILIRRKSDKKRVYTVQQQYLDTDWLARCSCPAYVEKNIRPCKHCFMVALNYLNRYIREEPWEQFNEAFKCVLLDDYETLKDLPMIDKTKLRGAYFHVKDQIPVTLPPTPKVSDDWQSETMTEQEQQWSESAKALVKTPESPPPMKATKAFGGTVGDIPKNLVITLHGKPYVTKAGLIYVASQMGLKKIETEPISWSWDNDDKRAVFKATVTFEDGKTFSAFGVAIPVTENVQMERMWAFIDHLAETRAVGRALRNAMAFREPSVEEMADYEEAIK